ncbi:uncharacterized protein Pyn_09487 [Prunus yedoensis var. nudiflora]|uniref:Sulfite exporter TauE/SafE family protein 3-like n=1 Tax=Prunus yedoensis var. nudiflora TaxID=2094558 RepID=A0A314YX07_PRUYE|nr:uncharacterized protein Pyn_09487 [Prunus yedoensis var. nudiflora]
MDDHHLTDYCPHKIYWMLPNACNQMVSCSIIFHFGDGNEDVEDRNIPGGPSNGTTETKEAKKARKPVDGKLIFAGAETCDKMFSGILVTRCLTDSSGCWSKSYAAVNLYKGRRTIASSGQEGANWRVHKLVLCCACGIAGGIVGGLLGLGGGFIMGPLFLVIGILHQVSSATSTFILAFSSSMSVVEFYLLKKFPIPYGGVGIANMVKQIEHEYIGFERMCSQGS